MSQTTPARELIEALADLRSRAVVLREQYREANDQLAHMQALEEQAGIGAGYTTSAKNAEDRARALALYLEACPRYVEARNRVRSLQAQIDHCEETIACRKDELRVEEMRVREKLADALLHQTVDLSAERSALFSLARSAQQLCDRVADVSKSIQTH